MAEEPEDGSSETIDAARTLPSTSCRAGKWGRSGAPDELDLSWNAFLDHPVPSSTRTEDVKLFMRLPDQAGVVSQPPSTLGSPLCIPRQPPIQIDDREAEAASSFETMSKRTRTSIARTIPRDKKFLQLGHHRDAVNAHGAELSSSTAPRSTSFQSMHSSQTPATGSLEWSRRNSKEDKRAVPISPPQHGWSGLEQLRHARDKLGQWRDRVQNSRTAVQQQCESLYDLGERLFTPPAGTPVPPAPLSGGSASTPIPMYHQPADFAEFRAAWQKLQEQEARLQKLEEGLWQAVSNVVAHAEAISTRAVMEASDNSRRSSLSGSASSFISESSEMLHPLARDYHRLVSHINILRDRLNDFELRHSDDLILRHAYERGDVPAWEEEQALVRRPRRDFLNDYFDTRREMVTELLNTQKQATQLREVCMLENLELEKPGEPNTLMEATKYNLDGPIGLMYAMHHEGIHHGVRPLELLQVPYLHVEDRFDHWQRDVHQALYDCSREERDRLTNSIPSHRGFELYYKRVQDGDGLPTDMPPHHPSAYTYGLQVYSEPDRWAVWAGEISCHSRPSSAPDRIKPPYDHFTSWFNDEVHSCALERNAEGSDIQDF